MRGFESLSEQEILALAISLEEEDERIYANFAEGLRQDFPATSAVFDGMRVEESGHRRRLIDHRSTVDGSTAHKDRGKTRAGRHGVAVYAPRMRWRLRRVTPHPSRTNWPTPIGFPCSPTAAYGVANCEGK
jgi:hypothetical protein